MQSSKGLRVPSRDIGALVDQALLLGFLISLVKEFTMGTNRSLSSILSEFKRKKNLRASKL